MATSLPSLTRTIDDDFVSTWYKIRKDAIDNILDANVLWVLLREKGCFTTQVGGQYITRTIRYGTQEAENVSKTDTLPYGEPDLLTMARWDWRYVASHVQRNAMDDQINSGPSKIRDYVKDRISAAREGLVEHFEDALVTATSSTAETTDKAPQGLFELVPLYASATSNTYGHISRPSGYTAATNGVYKPTSSGTNPWWGPYYMTFTSPMNVNLISDMKKMYNTVGANKETPNLIVTSQEVFETYEDFALDSSQIVKNMNTRAADLGFEVLNFKGKPMVWADGLVDSNSNNMMLFLNTNYIEVVYDPNMWFSMTNFKDITLSTNRVAHILSALNMIGTQLRRFGMLTEATVS